MIESEWACLELLKTRGWETRDREDDVLDSRPRFIAWIRKQGLLSPPDTRRLRAVADVAPVGFEDFVERTREVRSLFHGIFADVAEAGSPARSDLEALEATLSGAGKRLALRPHEGGGVSWRWNETEKDALAALEPEPAVARAADVVVGGLARSAADLLTSGELERVKVCDAHDCGWFFVDVSRNKSRRWCDMAGCGNRSKARRYRARHG